MCTHVAKGPIAGHWYVQPPSMCIAWPQATGLVLGKDALNALLKPATRCNRGRCDLSCGNLLVLCGHTNDIHRHMSTLNALLLPNTLSCYAALPPGFSVTPVAEMSAYQSSNLDSNGFDSARLVVDGNTNGDKSFLCSHTALTDTRPWLVIDLGHSRHVAGMRITNRQDCCTRKHGGDSGQSWRPSSKLLQGFGCGKSRYHQQVYLGYY